MQEEESQVCVAHSVYANMQCMLPWFQLIGNSFPRRCKILFIALAAAR